MKAEHILDVIGRYEKEFVNLSIQAIQHADHHCMANPRRAVEHAHWMLGQMREFVAQGKLEKAQLWLGFVQGVLWTNALYSLEELKSHNRST